MMVKITMILIYIVIIIFNYRIFKFVVIILSIIEAIEAKTLDYVPLVFNFYKKAGKMPDKKPDICYDYHG